MAHADLVDQAINRLKNESLFTGFAFIDGHWVEKKNTFEVVEPATEKILGHVANCDLADFQRAIESAYDAQRVFFRGSTAQSRGNLLRRWFELITANKDILATILSLENGKPIAESLGEIVFAASFVSWFADEAPRVYGTTIPSQQANTNVWTIKEPVGVCGIITPWNFPAAMITRKIAPALAVGCSVVIKPPSETPFTCLALTKLALEAGFPQAVIQVCPTKDRQAATELATNPLVNKLSFTGSTGVGKMLAKLAAGTLKRVSLELGGNAPFIVFDDADVDAAVDGAIFSKFRGSGQTCICANRILVQNTVVREFTQKLVHKVASLKLGLGLDSASTQGPLVNRSAVAKVQSHIEDAVSKGAVVEIGGSSTDGAGFFFQPTVISRVTEEMRVTSEETFGPLAAIFSFETEQDAVRLANHTEFGLAGYFFSRDVNRVMRVASELQVGMVGVNTGKISGSETPFGGVKESGYGREGSLHGIDEYITIKAITLGNLHL
ncbi:aldehyde dehydrogenase [Trichoderma pleuroticola]